jgi:hypothetical protein
VQAVIQRAAGDAEGLEPTDLQRWVVPADVSAARRSEPTRSRRPPFGGRESRPVGPDGLVFPTTGAEETNG